MKGKIVKLIITVISFNAFVWIYSLYFLLNNKTFLGMGLLAYFLGLRHAFDADHIAAIDNVTRKLRQENINSNSVGLFFSLGHSMVVVLLSLLIVIGLRNYRLNFNFFKSIGGIWGNIISGTFLLTIGIINFFILKKLIKIYKNNSKEKAKGSNREKEGIIEKAFSLINRHIDRPYKMLFVGFLFGLGFDTATEIGVLAISTIMTKNNSISSMGILSFSLLFTGGMTLMDTMDGILMFKIYDWVSKDKRKKIFFNILITAFTILVAIFIGSMEWIELILSKINKNLYILKIIEKINFEFLGVSIFFLMTFMWLVGFFYYKKLFTERQNGK